MSSTSCSIFRKLSSSRTAHLSIESARYAQLATIDSITFSPRVRTINIRDVIDQTKLVCTTDIRSAKMRQLFRPASSSSTVTATNTPSTSTFAPTLPAAAASILQSASFSLSDLESSSSLLPTHQPEICWYFPLTKQQYRFCCIASAITPSHPDTSQLLYRREMWKRSSLPSRAAFFQPFPGLPKESNSTSISPDDERVKSDIPSNNFVVLIFEIASVDYLELPGGVIDGVEVKEQRRWKWSRREKNRDGKDKEKDGGEMEWKEEEVNP